MTFYYLKDINKVGKIEDYVPYLYTYGAGWEVDNSNMLMDRVWGYDGDVLGTSDMLDSIEEITEIEANKLISKLNNQRHS